jgi:tRNA (adenine57-N1/adenine58-N1)-methyltransferase
MIDQRIESATYGDTILLVAKDRRSYVRTLTAGADLHTHLGLIHHDNLNGQRFGSEIRTHLNELFFLFRPEIPDLIAHARHETAIIQPKDLGYIALKLGVCPGTTVVEAGTGSGALTLMLASLVGDTGHVHSYERKQPLQEVAMKNLKRAGLLNRVNLIVRDIADGFEISNADSLFLDVPTPWEYLVQARAALAGGGTFGAIVPTINQVITLVDALYSDAWFLVEVEELLLRQYKISPSRIRPEDKMVGHTGYLVFARAVYRADPTSPNGETSGSDE